MTQARKAWQPGMQAWQELTDDFERSLGEMGDQEEGKIGSQADFERELREFEAMTGGEGGEPATFEELTQDVEGGAEEGRAGMHGLGAGALLGTKRPGKPSASEEFAQRVAAQDEDAKRLRKRALKDQNVREIRLIEETLNTIQGSTVRARWDQLKQELSGNSAIPAHSFVSLEDPHLLILSTDDFMGGEAWAQKLSAIEEQLMLCKKVLVDMNTRISNSTYDDVKVDDEKSNKETLIKYQQLKNMLKTTLDSLEAIVKQKDVIRPNYPDVLNGQRVLDTLTRKRDQLLVTISQVNFDQTSVSQFVALQKQKIEEFQRELSVIVGANSTNASLVVVIDILQNKTLNCSQLIEHTRKTTLQFEKDCPELYRYAADLNQKLSEFEALVDSTDESALKLSFDAFMDCAYHTEEIMNELNSLKNDIEACNQSIGDFIPHPQRDPNTSAFSTDVEETGSGAPLGMGGGADTSGIGVTENKKARKRRKAKEAKQAAERAAADRAAAERAAAERAAADQAAADPAAADLAAAGRAKAADEGAERGRAAAEGGPELEKTGGLPGEAPDSVYEDIIREVEVMDNLTNDIVHIVWVISTLVFTTHRLNNVSDIVRIIGRVTRFKRYTTYAHDLSLNRNVFNIIDSVWNMRLKLGPHELFTSDDQMNQQVKVRFLDPLDTFLQDNEYFKEWTPEDERQRYCSLFCELVCAVNSPDEEAPGAVDGQRFSDFCYAKQNAYAANFLAPYYFEYYSQKCMERIQKNDVSFEGMWDPTANPPLRLVLSYTLDQLRRMVGGHNAGSTSKSVVNEAISAINRRYRNDTVVLQDEWQLMVSVECRIHLHSVEAYSIELQPGVVQDLITGVVQHGNNVFVSYPQDLYEKRDFLIGMINCATTELDIYSSYKDVCDIVSGVTDIVAETGVSVATQEHGLHKVYYKYFINNAEDSTTDKYQAVIDRLQNLIDIFQPEHMAAPTGGSKGGSLHRFHQQFLSRLYVLDMQHPMYKIVNAIDTENTAPVQTAMDVFKKEVWGVFTEKDFDSSIRTAFEYRIKGPSKAAEVEVADILTDMSNQAQVQCTLEFLERFKESLQLYLDSFILDDMRAIYRTALIKGTNGLDYLENARIAIEALGTEFQGGFDRFAAFKSEIENDKINICFLLARIPSILPSFTPTEMNQKREKLSWAAARGKNKLDAYAQFFHRQRMDALPSQYWQLHGVLKAISELHARLLYEYYACFSSALSDDAIRNVLGYVFSGESVQAAHLYAFSHMLREEAISEVTVTSENFGQKYHEATESFAGMTRQYKNAEPEAGPGPESGARAEAGPRPNPRPPPETGAPPAPTCAYEIKFGDLSGEFISMVLEDGFRDLRREIQTKIGVAVIGTRVPCQFFSSAELPWEVGGTTRMTDDEADELERQLVTISLFSFEYLMCAYRFVQLLNDVQKGIMRMDDAFPLQITQELETSAHSLEKYKLVLQGIYDMQVDDSKNRCTLFAFLYNYLAKVLPWLDTTCSHDSDAPSVEELQKVEAARDSITHGVEILSREFGLCYDTLAGNHANYQTEVGKFQAELPGLLEQVRKADQGLKAAHAVFCDFVADLPLTLEFSKDEEHSIVVVNYDCTENYTQKQECLKSLRKRVIDSKHDSQYATMNFQFVKGSFIKSVLHFRRDLGELGRGYESMEEVGRKTAADFYDISEQYKVSAAEFLAVPEDVINALRTEIVDNHIKTGTGMLYTLMTSSMDRLCYDVMLETYTNVLHAIVCSYNQAALVFQRQYEEQGVIMASVIMSVMNGKPFDKKAPFENAARMFGPIVSKEMSTVDGDAILELIDASIRGSVIEKKYRLNKAISHSYNPRDLSEMILRLCDSIEKNFSNTRFDVANVLNLLFEQMTAEFTIDTKMQLTPAFRERSIAIVKFTKLLKRLVDEGWIARPGTARPHPVFGSGLPFMHGGGGTGAGPPTPPFAGFSGGGGGPPGPPTPPFFGVGGGRGGPPVPPTPPFFGVGGGGGGGPPVPPPGAPTPALVAHLQTRIAEQVAYIRDIRGAYSTLLGQARRDYAVAQKVREFYGDGYRLLGPALDDTREDFRPP